MSERLPSLNSLRAFVEVARQQSVSRAADALHLTHGAVSHQIRQLQEELGVPLYQRSGRGLRLTESGSTYADRLQRAFADMQAATHAVLADRHSRRLRVSCMPSFAAKWLLPRLGDFIAKHPDIDVEMQSTSRLADLKGGEADVALRFGRGGYPGLDSRLLMRDWYYPVCAPAFAEQHRLGDPHELAARLADLPLLHSDTEPWAPWLAAAGIDAPEPRRGPMFDDSSLMLLAAAGGQGLALARHSLAADDVERGRLVRPYAAVAESVNAYHFVCRSDEAGRGFVAAFRDWLYRQAEDPAWRPGPPA